MMSHNDSCRRDLCESKSFQETRCTTRLTQLSLLLLAQPRLVHQEPTDAVAARDGH